MSRDSLSLKTEEDLEDIYKYTCSKFNKNQRNKYLTGLQGTFELLAKNPQVGKQRDEIKPGLYSITYASRVIFYRIFQTHIRIVRVLSGKRDIIRLFLNKK